MRGFIFKCVAYPSRRHFICGFFVIRLSHTSEPLRVGSRPQGAVGVKWASGQVSTCQPSLSDRALGQLLMRDWHFRRYSSNIVGPFLLLRALRGYGPNSESE